MVDFVAGASGRLVVLTGAGCSTESGVPDYRSPEGSYSKGHKPMMHNAFVKEPLQRARYWARSLVGWRYFAGAQPNSAHYALAAMEEASLLDTVVTQNVDSLHSEAGSERVIYLHGRNDTVACLSCSARRPRVDFQEELEVVNAAWVAEFLPAVTGMGDIRADGDAHLAHEDFRDFRVPGCSKCGGIFKPDVVFFGGNLEAEVRQAARQAVADANRLLVVGSSCQVFSAYNLVQRASQAGKPVALVNIGATRVDPLVPLPMRFEVRCGEALMATCRGLGISTKQVG